MFKKNTQKFNIHVIEKYKFLHHQIENVYNVHLSSLIVYCFNKSFSSMKYFLTYLYRVEFDYERLILLFP